MAGKYIYKTDNFDFGVSVKFNKYQVGYISPKIFLDER